MIEILNEIVVVNFAAIFGMPPSTTNTYSAYAIDHCCRTHFVVLLRLSCSFIHLVNQIEYKKCLKSMLRVLPPLNAHSK